jgi:acyl carrier protein
MGYDPQSRRSISAIDVDEGMEAHVRQILRDHSGLGDAVNDIGIHHSLWHLGMTSMASVQVMLALETDFGFEFPEDRLRHATFASIHNIVRCVADLTGVGVSDIK